MANRFPGLPCALCTDPSDGVGEHVWPRWLLREFHGEGPFTTEKGGIPLTRRDGGTPVTAASLPGVHVPMCGDCNGRLNQLIEEPAKEVVRRLIPWSANHQWPTLSAGEAAALARWFLKVGILSGHPAAVHDNPHVNREADYPRFDEVEPEWLDWMRSGSSPPRDFSVYVARRSIRGEQPWAGDTQRIVLPRRVVVDGKALRYVARSFGIRGLDVTIVWHPDWPLQHPLEAVGRVARLWPTPSPVDFSALPEVHPREVSFVLGLGTQVITATEFQQLTSQPLSVHSDPFLSFFGS